MVVNHVKDGKTVLEGINKQIKLYISLLKITLAIEIYNSEVKKRNYSNNINCYNLKEVIVKC